MEKELRGLKGRGHFPIPNITPNSARIENPHQIRKFLEAVDKEMVHIITTLRESERNYEKEKEEARIREQQTRTTRSTQHPEYNFLTLNSSTPIKNMGTTGNQNQHTERSIHFNPNPIHHLYSMTETTSHNSWYEPPANDSIIQGAGTAPGGQFTTNTTSVTSAAGRNDAWRNNNGSNAPTHTNFPACTTRTTGHNGFFNDSPNSSNNINASMCFRCGEHGHMRNECEIKRVFCTYCKSTSHSNRACRKLTNSTPSPTNSHTPTGYHPTATPPSLPGSTPNLRTHTTAQPQQTGTSNNGLRFQNYPDTNQPRTSTTVHTPFTNKMSPASSTNVTEAITQLLTQVVSNKKDDVSKQVMKNIKTFERTNRTECINWLSQIEATSKFSNSSFHKLVCQGMAPSMLHVLSELSPMSTDQEIKDIILANYSDIPSTAEAAAKLQSMQMPPSEPLISFNSRYEAIH